MNWSLAVATNDEHLLNTCLLSSPDVGSASQVIVQRGYRSAALAYNGAIDAADSDIVVLAHQDVYLPPGWLGAMSRSLEWLEMHEIEWGVLGVCGLNQTGNWVGHVFCTGLMCPIGGPFAEPAGARTLDELLLIVRKPSGLRFDEALPGYHLYGTDICLEAAAMGLSNFAIPAFCIHNTNGYGMLPRDFWNNYLMLRKKWRSELPIKTPCTEITGFGLPAIRWSLKRGAAILTGKHRQNQRVDDPVSLYNELEMAGTTGLAKDAVEGMPAR
jgi:hypothetical protein